MNAGSNLPPPQALATEPPTASLLGTSLVLTDYDGLLKRVGDWAQRSRPTAVEFCNTQVLALRRTEASFGHAIEAYDYFLPDGMPLIWCLRAMGFPLRDRVYGPAFMRHALIHETGLTHYFLGGSEITSQKLVEQAATLSAGRFRLVGATHRYAQPSDSPAIVAEINRLSPDVIWIGLGTPKQQQWIRDNKPLIARGVLLTVGFAFDVNAGTKRDAPLWMQKLGLTWIFRISQEPSRLLGRYLKYNTCFVLLLILDLLRFLGRSIRSWFTRSPA